MTGLGLATGCAQNALPWQPSKVPRVGVLSSRTPAAGAELLDALRGGLRDLGYEEGRNIVLEPRFTEGRSERYPELLAELHQLGVAVIVVNEPNAIVIAQRASGTIPIVMAGASEVPVERGLVASLSRPGGNITGLSDGTSTLAAKRLELLKQAVPELTSVAFVNDPAISPVATNPKVGLFRSAAVLLGLHLVIANLPPPDQFGALFADLARQGIGGVFIDGSPATYTYRLRLSELAIQHRIAAIGQGSRYKDAALLAYGSNSFDLWRRSATHVDKLLKGANPADLPVEQPTNFDFVVNLPIARALGLTVPEAVLRQATEIIQ